MYAGGTGTPHPVGETTHRDHVAGGNPGPDPSPSPGPDPSPSPDPSPNPSPSTHLNELGIEVLELDPILVVGAASLGQG